MTADDKLLYLWDAGEEDGAASYAGDQLMMTMSAAGKQALTRIWHHGYPALSLGRFHRRPFGADTMLRRSSGGRVAALGPGILGLTMAFPAADWLAGAGGPLRPDQVLNRALRPLLAALRACGADVIYPGRDLVTLEGCPLAHAAFTIASDGVCLVQAHLGLESSLAATAGLLAAADPDQVAGVDTAAFESALCLRAARPHSPSRDRWAELLSEHIAVEFDCRVEPPGAERLQGHLGAAAEAFDAFQHELGPLAPGRIVAAAPGMLGLVECSATLEQGRLGDLRLSGDFIAPFHTVEALRLGCEGGPYDMPAIRRVLAQVMRAPRNFILGIRDLDALLSAMN